MRACLTCKYQVYSSDVGGSALCIKHSAKPPLPARNFPLNLSEQFPDYHFFVPPWCKEYAMNPNLSGEVVRQLSDIQTIAIQKAILRGLELGMGQ